MHLKKDINKQLNMWSVRRQVINIINAAQESSPVTVAEALDRVLEILRTTELYSPQLASKEDDPHTNDLVGGLMSVSWDRLWTS